MKSKLLFLYALALLFITACGNADPQSPEQRVLYSLEQMELAAEQRSVSDFMQHVSDDYQDHQGLAKADIKRIVQLQYLRNQRIHILSKVIDLTVNGDLASVEIATAMASKASDLDGDFSLIKADTHHFSAVFRSPDQQQSWLLESVSWQRGWD